MWYCVANVGGCSSFANSNPEEGDYWKTDKLFSQVASETEGLAFFLEPHLVACHGIFRCNELQLFLGVG